MADHTINLSRYIWPMISYLGDHYGQYLTNDETSQLALFAANHDKTREMLEDASFHFFGGIVYLENAWNKEPFNISVKEHDALDAVAEEWANMSIGERNRYVLEHMCDHTTETSASYQPGISVTVGDIISMCVRNMPVTISKLWSFERFEFDNAVDVPIDILRLPAVMICGPSTKGNCGITICADFGEVPMSVKRHAAEDHFKSNERTR